MKGAEIAGILGGLAAVLAAVLGAWAALRSDKLKQGSDSAKNRVDNAAVLLGGWEKYAEKTLQEVDRVREQCEKEIAAVKREHDEDRAEWLKEKTRMQAEIDQLRAQYAVLVEAQARRDKPQ